MEGARRKGAASTYGAVTAGEGAQMNWKSCRLNGEVKIVQSVQDDHVTYELVLEPCNTKFEGVLALEAIGGSTRVTWFCKWVGGPNPYARYIDLFAKVYLKRDFYMGLENLRELVTSKTPA